MTYLMLVRHGESRWNLTNKFTGWVDVPLSENGIKEALIAAKQMKNFPIDIAFTSKLERAQETLLIILAYQNKTGIFIHNGKDKNRFLFNSKQFSKNEIPIYSDNSLNERHYGDLQGIDKDVARKKFGKDQVFIWRRSFDVTPPKGESLKKVINRSVPYFNKKILPELKKRKNIIVSAHGNSLRGLIKYIENISDNDIPNLELPTGKPIVYKYSKGKFKKMGSDFSFDRPINWK